MSINYELLNNEILKTFGTPEGPNCSECVLLYGMKSFNLNISDDLLRIATPFGSGIARCEDICGVITGGMLLIGLKYGRTNLNQGKYESYFIAEDFLKWFKNKFGSSNCHKLNHGDFVSEEHHIRCSKTFITKALEYLDDLFAKVDNDEWIPSV